MCYSGDGADDCMCQKGSEEVYAKIEQFIMYVYFE